MGAASAISTLTLPVPAPTSHRVSVGATASLASAAARTSCLVIGVLPRMKASSGRPGTRGCGLGQGSTSSTLSGAKLPPASVCTVSVMTSCCGVPRFSPTVACTAPKPAAARISHSAAGLVLRPPVKKKVGRSLRHSAAGAQAHPWALTRCQFCHGLPSAAANSCTLEIPGSTVTSAPCARSLGTSAAAPE